MRKASITIDYRELEKRLIKSWEEMNLFKQVQDKNQNGKRFRFLDGPITANNRAGIHHFWGRIIKDVSIRYNLLKGKSCQCQNGFDAQGMWVEVNVEKELGLNGKPEIVEYGLDKFTNKCMERVNYFAGEITNQSKRLGQFMDWEHSYFTNTDENITSIWHFLKICDENGWLVQKNRPMVWCPRCGTSISEHELSGSYSDVTHTAIFVKLPVKNKDYKIIAWTTTPWTLCANVALAVNEELDYVLVEDNQTKEKLVLGKNSLKVIKDYTVLEEFKGSKLVGLEYETCFPELNFQNFTHKILPWEEVDSTEGSCVVHIAPGCGAEDFDLGKRYDLPEICPINDQGIMLDDCGFIAGKKTTDVVEDVVNRLKEDNKLLYAHKYKHSYPHCWRCKTDLVYKLISTWYIKMDEIRPKLLKAIEDVEFKPEYAKKRMADWLNNMGDWNISRSRFYGLPLPIYKCDCGKIHVIGSLEELKQKAVNPSLVDKLPNIHRPWIDDIKIKCDCGKEINRITEVGDCWLDAGITPFSTKKYFTDKEYFENNFPSEFVCEMIEQIKLWFYSCLVMSVVLTGKAPYEKIVTYQYVKDENGDEFHKSGGNSLDADIVADKCGAEAIRYLYAGANPVNDMRFGFTLTDEAKKKLNGFWNIYVFFNTYACIDNPDLSNFKFDYDNASKIDKWLLSRVDKFVKDSDENYSEYKSFNVIKDFEVLVDDISNFYIRTNRKRFYNSGTVDQLNAYYVLYTAIKKIIGVMAPILPFLTEEIWQEMVREIEKDEVQSIHLSNFPNVDKIDEELLSEVEKVRDVIYLAQKLRNEYKIKVKQPLNVLYLKAEEDYQKAILNYKDLVLEEVNIKNIEFVSEEDKFNDEYLTLNFKKAGQVLKGDVNNVKNALSAMSEQERKQAVKNFKAGKKVEVLNYSLESELFELKISAKTGFAIATLENNLVALDVNLTDELIDEGTLREIIRQVQVARKDANFEISDRITLYLTSENKDTERVIEKYKQTIMQETLATKFEDNKAEYETTADITNASITIKLKR